MFKDNLSLALAPVEQVSCVKQTFTINVTKSNCNMKEFFYEEYIKEYIKCTGTLIIF